LLAAPGAANAAGGKPAIPARKLEPVPVRAIPADSLLGITRQAPVFACACFTTGRGASGSGEAGLTGCFCADAPAKAHVISKPIVAMRNLPCRPVAGPGKLRFLHRRGRFACLKELSLKKAVIQQSILAWWNFSGSDP
jgi:hypothetical protein